MNRKTELALEAGGYDERWGCMGRSYIRFLGVISAFWRSRLGFSFRFDWVKKMLWTSDTFFRGGGGI